MKVIINKIKKQYWNDPVWSKVIASIIISIAGILLVLINSFYQNVPVYEIISNILSFFKSTTEVNNLILSISIIILLGCSIHFLNKTLKKNRKIEEIEDDEYEELPKIGKVSTVLFADRLASAFPGQRGLEWYDAKTAVKRLSIVFKEPLEFEPIQGSEAIGDPFWCFRSGFTNSINKFEKLSNTKILLGIDELEIKRIAVYISPSYYKCFIYVETKGEKQIGLYNYTQETINDKINTFGYCSEEYALFGKKPISREHYDDGATIINGNVVQTFGSQLRKRYLSEYNFLIAAKQSPFNSKEGDNDSYDYMDSILNGKKNADEFLTKLQSYKRKFY